MPSTEVDSCDYYIRIFFSSIKPIVKLTIWDTAGQEKFKSITKDYYRDADAIVIVYDVNNRESFDHIDQWV
jgi:GTPase SAR1 family protein